MTAPKKQSTAKPRKSRAKKPAQAPKPAPKLSVDDRRTAFVEAYLQNGGNATQAALAAGFSKRSAYSTGGRLVKHAEVLARIEQRQAELRKKFELTTETLLNNLRQAVMFDPRKLYDENGALKSVADLDDDTAMALTGLEQCDEFEGRGASRKWVGITKKIKWLDKNVARDQANKILGMYEKDNTQPRAAIADAMTEANRIAKTQAAFDKHLGRDKS